MTVDRHRAAFALDRDQPPADFSPLRQALWWDAKGDWGKAHDLVAANDGRLAARIHAYLHRREGDPGNARYWYGLAGHPPHTGTLDQEWAELAGSIAE